MTGEALTALILSSASVTISAFAIGWNVYRDVIAKPHLKVRMNVGQIVGPGIERKEVKVIVTCTNFGPGVIICNALRTITYKSGLFKRLLRRVEHHGLVMYDWPNPQAGALPKKLEVGEKFDLLLPYTKDGFIGAGISKIGIADTFGRTKWAPTEDLKSAVEQYRKDFPSKNPTVENS